MEGGLSKGLLEGESGADFSEAGGGGGGLIKVALEVVVEFGASAVALSRIRTTCFSPVLPSRLRGPCLRRTPQTTEKKAEGWRAAPGVPGGARALEQHAELGPVATSEAP